MTNNNALLRSKPVANYRVYIFFLAALVLLSGCKIREAKIYRIANVIEEADLDYQMLNNIDNITPPYPPGGKYQIGDIKTIKGKYTVYKFICEFYGRSKLSEKPVLFHDLLVVKTDKEKKILDAYHYTLEWTDRPSLDLYRLKNKDVYLKNGLSIKKLQLTIINNGKELEENGILDIPPASIP